MAAEQQPGISLTGIQLDLGNRSVLFLAQKETRAVSDNLDSGDEPVAALHFDTNGGLRLQLLGALSASQQTEQVLHQCGIHSPGLYAAQVLDGCSSHEPESIGAEADPSAAEKQTSVVLSGKLISKVREGRADSAGRPTAWARFGVCKEGSEAMHHYLATFHRGSRSIALSLPNRAAITAEGYIHPATSPSRLDTFSVFAIHNPRGTTLPPAASS